MNTCPQHVTNSASSEIVNEEPLVFFAFAWPPLIRFTFNSLWSIWNACISVCNEFAKTNSNTSALPRLSEIPNGLALRVKHMWTAKQPTMLRAFEDFQKLVLHWQQPTVLIFA